VAPGTLVSRAEQVAARLAAVRSAIEATGRDPDSVRIVAVTKGHGADAARAALGAGLVDLGESYGQELAAKAAELAADPGSAPPRWHAIGRLQRNKVRLIAPHVGLWQSVDRAVLAEEIARRAPGAAVLVQVDVTGEPQKGGCPPGEVAGLVSRCDDLGLSVRGLMAVGPAGPPPAARPGFLALVALADRHGLEIRSMGMSGDLEVAVTCGSTMVRVGTDLLGPRPTRTPMPGVVA